MAVAVIGAGMVTSVGLLGPTSCAAIRCKLNRFEDTRVKLDGEWVIGASIPLPGDPRGKARLLTMAALPIEECLRELPRGQPGDTAWVVCLAEPDRRGRPRGLDEAIRTQLYPQLVGRERLGPHSQLLTGVLAPVRGLQWLERVLASGAATYGILAAADGFLHPPTLAALHASGYPLSGVEREGLTPGEAGAAIVVSAPRWDHGELQCLGVGWGHEPATVGSGQPVRGEGLADAYREALSSSGLHDEGCGFAQIDYRIADIGVPRPGLREAALALARTMRVRKDSLELWHPAECIGHVGAAAFPIAVGLAFEASRRAYAPGPGVLVHVGAFDGGRAAVVIREHGRASSPPLE